MRFYSYCHFAVASQWNLKGKTYGKRSHVKADVLVCGSKFRQTTKIQLESNVCNELLLDATTQHLRHIQLPPITQFVVWKFDATCELVLPSILFRVLGSGWHRESHLVLMVYYTSTLPLPPAPSTGGSWLWSTGRMVIGRRKLKVHGRKPASVLHSPPEISYGLPSD